MFGIVLVKTSIYFILAKKSAIGQTVSCDFV